MSIYSFYKDGDVLRTEHCQDLLVAAVLDEQLDDQIPLDIIDLQLYLMDAVAIKHTGDENMVVWEPSYECH